MTTKSITCAEAKSKAHLFTDELNKLHIPEGIVLFLLSEETNSSIAAASAQLLKKDHKIRILPPARCNRTLKTLLKHFSEEELCTKDQILPLLEDTGLIIDTIGMQKSEDLKQLADILRKKKIPVYSLGINAGCEADGHCSEYALSSEKTFVLDQLMPFHLLRKEHQMFRELVLLSEDTNSSLRFMNEDIFFSNIPRKSEQAHKGSEGRALFISGSYGMAGAAALNLLGAETIGASYIQQALPDSIYPIVAGMHATTVYHPFTEYTWHEVLSPLIENARSICFGSGAVYMPHKEQILDLILQESSAPVVLDAEALQLLKHNTYILRFAKVPVILTPHIKEFSTLTNVPPEVLHDDLLYYAKKFALENHVILVLKGANTIVTSPAGEVYINQSGNAALAQAGSGDVLTGMIGALLTMTCDVYQAVLMAVWLHGYLADLGTRKHAVRNFRLERFPKLMDKLYAKHGF